MSLNETASLVFVVVLYSIALWLYAKTRKFKLVGAIVLLCSIEFVHFFQFKYAATELPSQYVCASRAYTVNLISPCDTYTNKIFTLLSYLHFCFQPFLIHVINGELVHSKKLLEQYKVVQSLCFIAGILWFGRYFLSFAPGLNSRLNPVPALDTKVATEWFRGHQLCSYARSWSSTDGAVTLSKLQLLGTSVPLADSSYALPSLSLHGFLMFAPYIILLVEEHAMLARMLLLLLAGPVASSLLTDSIHEKGNFTVLFCATQLLIVILSLRHHLFAFWESSSEEDEVCSVDDVDKTD